MHRIISFYIIQQLLFFTTSVELLKGKKVVNAYDGEFSFVASLQKVSGRHFCSGSLITMRHILTAAHCLTNENPQGVRIVLGVTDLQNATVRYNVAPWYTYTDWATNLSIEGAERFHDVAIVPLLDEITNDNTNSQPNIIPVRLSEFTKQQVQRSLAITLGWRVTSRFRVLTKAIVNVLMDDDCARRVTLITNKKRYIWNYFSLKFLCTAAHPYVLLDDGDSGGPLLDSQGALLGIHFGDGPHRNYTWGNFSEEFLRRYQVNVHPSIDYPKYQYFIMNITGYH